MPDELLFRTEWFISTKINIRVNVVSLVLRAKNFICNYSAWVQNIHKMIWISVRNWCKSDHSVVRIIKICTVNSTSSKILHRFILDSHIDRHLISIGIRLIHVVDITFIWINTPSSWVIVIYQPCSLHSQRLGTRTFLTLCQSWIWGSVCWSQVEVRHARQRRSSLLGLTCIRCLQALEIGFDFKVFTNLRIFWGRFWMSLRVLLWKAR